MDETVPPMSPSSNTGLVYIRNNVLTQFVYLENSPTRMGYSYTSHSSFEIRIQTARSSLSCRLRLVCPVTEAQVQLLFISFIEG